MLCTNAMKRMDQTSSKFFGGKVQPLTNINTFISDRRNVDIERHMRRKKEETGIEEQHGTQPEMALISFQWLVVSKKALSMVLLLTAVCQDSR